MDLKIKIRQRKIKIRKNKIKIRGCGPVRGGDGGGGVGLHLEGALGLLPHGLQLSCCCVGMLGVLLLQLLHGLLQPGQFGSIP